MTSLQWMILFMASPSRFHDTRHVKGGTCMYTHELAGSTYDANMQVSLFTLQLQKRDKGMLKITKVVTSTEKIILKLDGRVAGEWTELLRELGESVLAEGMRLTLDLKNVSFIDCEGIAVLKRLIARGANTVNPPLFVVEQIRKCKDVPDQ